jgi:hypothetical protein
MNDQGPKPAGQIVPGIIERLQTQYGTASSPDATTANTKSCSAKKDLARREVHRERPLRTEWQRKFLDFEVTHSELQLMADTIQEWWMTFFRRDLQACKLLTIAGPVRTGKTRAARKICWLADHFDWSKSGWSHRPRIHWEEFAGIATIEIREFERWMYGHKLCPVDMLFLEDVGAEIDRYRSDEPTERLRQILNLFEDRWVFITTNISPQLWEDRWDQRVAARMIEGHVISHLNVRRFSGTPQIDIDTLRKCNR